VEIAFLKGLKKSASELSHAYQLDTLRKVLTSTDVNTDFLNFCMCVSALHTLKVKKVSPDIWTGSQGIKTLMGDFACQ